MRKTQINADWSQMLGRTRPDPQSDPSETKDDGGAVQGDPADFKAKPVAKDLFWMGERDGYGPPDLVIKAPEYTMPAVSQDQWWRPVSEIPVTEPRWVRMVEIRPTNIQSRKILHHSIAYHILSPENAEAVAIRFRCPVPRRRPRLTSSTVVPSSWNGRSARVTTGTSKARAS